MGLARGRGALLVEVAAVLWLVVLAAVFLAPALAHGVALGPADVLRELGLTSQPNPVIHNAVGSDEIEEFIPWQALSWVQVHHGQFPLWNPDSVLGMPLAFNLQSAPFSLPVALSYLFPLALTHTVAIAARLLIGATGVYVFGRVVGLAPLPAVVGASIFELSGAYTIWLGAYESGCLGFAGWILTACVLITRQRRRARAVAALALALALALAAGEPQIAIVLVGSVAVFAAVLARSGARGAPGAGRRVVSDHVAGILAGGALVAPLYLPATQLGLISGRAKSPGVSNLPLYDLTHLIFAGYNGVPTDLGAIIGPNDLYVAMLYVGVIALVLAAVAFTNLARRRLVAATAAMGVVLLVALFVPLVPDIFRRIPLLRVFRLDLATPLLDLALALLAGFGAEALVAPGSAGVVPGTARRPLGIRATPDRVLVAATAAIGALLAVLGIRLALNVDHLDAAESALRARSFLWPALSVASCSVVAAARALARRRPLGSARLLAGRGGLALLLLVESAFLVLAGEGTITAAGRLVPRSAATARLARIVGTSLVGIGSCQENAFPNAGILPNANLVYGISELSVYDPILPASYYRSYGALAGTTERVLWPHVFCPAIDSVRRARFYGVGYILEPPGVAPPPGVVHVTTLHGEGLYRVLDSGRATLSSASGTRVVPASQPTPGTWRIALDSTRPGTLALRVTGVPGWTATIDGRPLALGRLHGILLAARVPAGRHVVVLRYWPRLLGVGLALAGAAGAGLLGALAWEGRRRRAAAEERHAHATPGARPVRVGETR